MTQEGAEAVPALRRDRAQAHMGSPRVWPTYVSIHTVARDLSQPGPSVIESFTSVDERSLLDLFAVTVATRVCAGLQSCLPVCHDSSACSHCPRCLLH